MQVSPDLLCSLLTFSRTDNYSWQTYPATTNQSTNVQWQFQLPSTNSIIDRCALVEANVQLVFTGVPFDGSTPLVQLDMLNAIRDWPLAHSVGTTNITFDNMTITQDHQFIDPLLRMNMTKNARLLGASCFPSMLDVFPAYTGWNNLPGARSGGANRNPLTQGYVNGEMGRASFPMSVISNAPGATTATIQFKVFEPIPVPPFLQSIEGVLFVFVCWAYVVSQRARVRWVWQTSPTSK